MKAFNQLLVVLAAIALLQGIWIRALQIRADNLANRLVQEEQYVWHIKEGAKAIYQTEEMEWTGPVRCRRCLYPYYFTNMTCRRQESGGILIVPKQG